MSLALQSMLTPAPGYPERPSAEENESGINITVVFTSVEATLAALERAGALASDLGARITLLAPQVVPYPLPLASPPVSRDFNERRFRVIAGESRVKTSVCVYLCRDRMETLRAVLKPHSLVVIGGSRRWWPSSETRLAGRLRLAGHEVILAERK